LSEPAAPAAGEPETRVEKRGRAGFIVLDRPKALNALTLRMVRDMAAALDAFERDPGVERVVVTGSGGRAFCAGGDIRRLYEQGRAGDHAAQRLFWREEYILNRRIRTFSKPYYALIDGIVMGGGVGVSLHGSHRIVGERAVFAMPEVGIGFFPDVGASWLLPRLPRRLGWFLALTGLRAHTGDLLATGLATHAVASAALADVERALEGGAGDIEAALTQARLAPPASRLAGEAGWIESAFAEPGLDEIAAAVARAADAGSALAAEAVAAMRAKSPTSQAIAWEQMKRGASASFDEVMRMEFRIVSRICVGADFYEGVRALIVDKDNAPRWAPAPADVSDYFAPLPPAEDLAFPEVAG